MAGAGFHVSFYTTVTVVQAMLALFLVLRRPRSEVAWILALLFAFNAMVSASFANEWAVRGALGPTPAHARIYHLFDPPTSLLMAYLALVFPRPPQALRGRPWLRNLLWILPLLLWWSYAGPRDPDTFSGLPPHPFRLDFLFLTVMPVVGWVAILARVGVSAPRLHEDPLARMNALVLAAFAIRAANLGVFEALSKFTFDDWVPGTTATIRGALIATHAVVVAWVVVRLVMARSHIAPARRDAVDLLLIFLFLGVLEAFWTHTERVNERATHLFSVFDVYVVRPALVWFAVSRHDLLSIALRGPRISLAAIGGLSWVGFHYAMESETFAPAPEAVVPWLRYLVPPLLGALLVLVIGPFLAGRRQRTRDMVDLETYTSRLAYVMGRGGDAATDPTLRTWRQRLDIDAAVHERLVADIDGRDTIGPGEWIPGDAVAGRYRVEGRVGEGGGGRVHLATDTRTGKAVALKRTRTLDSEERTLLLNEATHAARVGHPHILPLLSVEKHGDEPVLVFPHAEEGSLKGRLLREGPLAADEAVASMLLILDALQAAHDAGFVHADVKPSNILLGAGGPWLADFGVARPLPPPNVIGDPTQPSVSGGTLRYMAPEQVQGLPATGASDVYAAALTLYETIEGRTWIDDTLTDYETRKAIVEGHLPTFTERTPDALERVLRKAGHVKAERRYRSMADFSDALRRSESS